MTYLRSSNCFRLGTLAIATFGLAALTIGAAPAQEMPPPNQELSLAFKYQTGNLQKFRLEAKSDLSVTPDGGGIGPLPISSKITTLYSEKITGTREGTGTIAAKVDSFLIDTNALGNTLVGKLVDGKLKYTVNGQPAPADGFGAALAGGGDMSKTLTVKRDARGAVTEGGNPNAGGAGPGSTIAQFPDHPVKVGDTWETEQTVGAGVANGPLGGGAAPLQAKFTHTLKEIVSKGGKTFALIESIGTSVPPAGDNAFAVKQSVSGITRFDVARGVVVSGQYSIDLSMKVGAPAGLGGAPAGANGAAAPKMKVDGITTLTLQEITDTPAKTGAKKPAAKSRTKKKTGSKR